MKKKSLFILSGISLIILVCLIAVTWCYFHNGDFCQKETVSVETVNDYRHPLIARTEDGRTRLFAESGGEYRGVILKAGKRMYSFDWTWRNGGFNLPKVYEQDFDGDGQEEVMCILDLDGGTGISVYQLHMLEFNGKECKDIVYNSYLVDLGKIVTYQIDREKDMVRFCIDNVMTDIKTDTIGEASKLERIVYDDQVYFSYEDGKMMLDILPGFKFRDMEFPLYRDIFIRAQVNYENGEFYLSDVSLQ